MNAQDAERVPPLHYGSRYLRKDILHLFKSYGAKGTLRDLRGGLRGDYLAVEEKKRFETKKAQNALD